jgi:fatty acid-binding protein DegV
MEEMQGLNIHLVPLTLTGENYRSGIDIQPAEFTARPKNFPTTSQPSPGDFADLYRELARTDPEILSAHFVKAERHAQCSAPGCAVGAKRRSLFVDTKTLSGAEGWRVQAAALSQGWLADKIVELLDKTGDRYGFHPGGTKISDSRWTDQSYERI